MRAVCTFSCIGNHALGLARAGIETIAFCEIDAWRRDRLAESFPGVQQTEARWLECDTQRVKDISQLTIERDEALQGQADKANSK